VSAPGIWITRLAREPEGRRLAVKDLFDTAGIRTTYGSVVFSDRLPARTATAVELLEDAGWVNAGKANLHEFAYGITSQNPHYGTVPNPRFPGRTAGGSSGGSAAAIAAGEADLGLGTDTGGSIRIPAACCELTGFKPTFGLVPIEGCFPLAPSFDHVGPIARDVAGCAGAMVILAGLEERPVTALADLEVALAWADRAEPEVGARIEEAAAVFTRVSPLDLPNAAAIFPAFQREIAEVHRDLFAEHGALYGANVGTKVERCLDVTDEQDAAARAIRGRYRDLVDEAFASVDLILTPTLPIPPPRAEEDELDLRDRMTENTFPWNAVGAPALALPAGRTQAGWPVSLQLVGRPGDDAFVLAVGARLEAELRHTAPSREEPGQHQERGA
jgi:aspartyl-tRNA(Asn)/glutamyl-tRNA(Gln) amidotransferase subunit A